jgi:hypothetical protein
LAYAVRREEDKTYLPRPDTPLDNIKHSDANSLRVEIGDRVVLAYHWGAGSWDTFKRYKGIELTVTAKGKRMVTVAHPRYTPFGWFARHLKIVNPIVGLPPMRSTAAIFKLHQNLKGEEMNKSIAAVYEKTADAVLVDKYYRSFVQENAFGQALLELVKDTILKEAQRLEEEAKVK